MISALDDDLMHFKTDFEALRIDASTAVAWPAGLDDGVRFTIEDDDVGAGVL